MSVGRATGGRLLGEQHARAVDVDDLAGERVLPVADDARERAALVVDRVEGERERAGLRAAADRDRTAGRRRETDRRRHRLAGGEAAALDGGRAEIGRPLGDLDVRAAEAVAACDQGAPVLGHRRRVIDDQLEAPVLRP